MPPNKSSTRFRNRKINFKTRISIRSGIEAEDFFSDEEEDYNPSTTSGGNNKKGAHGGGGGGGGVDTGVDKEEEGEVHLQEILKAGYAGLGSSNSSSLLGGRTSFTLRPGGTGFTAIPITNSNLVKPKAFIPTPDSTGTIDVKRFEALYPKASFVDPITYIKFSDTVEESMVGNVGYTMDEDDDEFLTALNARLRGEKSEGEGVGEDVFEEIMDLFERVTEEKAPMAHVVRHLFLSLPQSFLFYRERLTKVGKF